MTTGSDRDDTPAAETTTPSSGNLVGHRLDEYQVLRKLGRGGMADVYAAKQLSLGRDVALKVLRQEYSSDKSYIERFRREARAAARLNSPHIVQVYDVKSSQGLHFIAQELIDGQNLREYLSSHGTLEPELATDVLLAVGQALDLAATAGITHRDIKPENILRSSTGVIKVADFGLARSNADTGKSTANLTQAGLTMGTPRYMSPEQIQGKPADSRSDLYSLGVSMYHLLAGQPPFEADDPLALAVMHLHNTPEPLDRARRQDDLPEWLVSVVSRLMSKLPEDRFQSPGELLQTIAPETSGAVTITSLGTAAATTRLQRATQAATKRRRAKVAKVACIISLPILCGAAGAWWATSKPLVNVSELLTSVEVIEMSSVERQWLEAVRRKDTEGWNAVAKYFPPDENQTNREYANKAKLQLMALHIRREEYNQAKNIADAMLRDEQVRDVYRIAAHIRRLQAVRLQNPNAVTTDLQNQLDNAYQSFKTNSPGKVDLLAVAFTPEELRDVGLRSEET